MYLQNEKFVFTNIIFLSTISPNKRKGPPTYICMFVVVV